MMRCFGATQRLRVEHDSYYHFCFEKKFFLTIQGTYHLEKLFKVQRKTVPFVRPEVASLLYLDLKGISFSRFVTKAFQVPSMAIEKVYLYQNTSIIQVRRKAPGIMLFPKRTASHAKSAGLSSLSEKV